MNPKQAIKSQYLAMLEMLKQAVEKCPDHMWANPDHNNPFWLLAYHTLFYTHLYLQPRQEDFTPWEKSRPDIQFMGPTPWPPHETPDFGEPYTREELLEYLALVQTQVKDIVDSLNLEGESGFEWIPLDKLELQFYSIRHTQQHIGELCERLGETAGIDVDWVGMVH